MITSPGVKIKFENSYEYQRQKLILLSLFLPMYRGCSGIKVNRFSRIKKLAALQIINKTMNFSHSRSYSVKLKQK
ncbi:hypothetical protein PROVALCAL_01535 [Providencia alcalifaciens DSM 30120]|uniref:Uncharacterized protein n=1 Tax=Providencia alcalifaciens DSM 30120 TaxID=520999 RepID=B6XDV9_9GAMM|nr:hypothetical protein PROVALCAL_01535 [Providencia alcalifaciens DSM 30120]